MKKKLAFVVAVLSILVMVFGGCFSKREPLPLKRITFKMKMVDGSWTQPVTMMVPEDFVIGINGYKGTYTLSVYGSFGSGIVFAKPAVIDYLMIQNEWDSPKTQSLFDKKE